MHRILLLCLCLFLAACSAERGPGSLFGPSEQGTPVVDALLMVGQPMPDVFVRQTLAPNVPYTRAASAVRGAEVVLLRGTDAYRYAEAGDSLGRYRPPAGAPMILPDAEYRLLVRIGDREVRGVTHTPGRLVIDESVMIDPATLEKIRDLKTFRDGPDAVFTAPENQVRYQENLLEARFQPIGVKGYQVGVFNLEKDSDFVIEADFLDEEDYENFERQSSSPPLEVPEGHLRLPWFAIYYAGRHLIKVYALDDNWFDYARSGPEQPNAGFGNLAGDHFERPLFRLEGGIGLFGSASVDSLGFVILPK